MRPSPLLFDPLPRDETQGPAALRVALMLITGLLSRDADRGIGEPKAVQSRALAEVEKSEGRRQQSPIGESRNGTRDRCPMIWGTLLADNF